MKTVFIQHVGELPNTYKSYIEANTPVERAVAGLKHKFPWFDPQIAIVCQPARKVFFPAEYNDEGKLVCSQS